MVIAALISFGILLVAWIAAPGDEVRREVDSPTADLEMLTAEGVARAA
jgi:hypothetical protein